MQAMPAPHGNSRDAAIYFVMGEENEMSPRRALCQPDGVHALARTAQVSVLCGQPDDSGQRRHEGHRPSALRADQSGRSVFDANHTWNHTVAAHELHLGSTTERYRNSAGSLDEDADQPVYGGHAGTRARLR